MASKDGLRCRRLKAAIAFLLGAGSLVPVLLSLAAAASNPYPSGGRGNDISFPQCGGNYPTIRAFAVVGVNRGRAFTDNPCLASEFAWASTAVTSPSLYMNISGAFGSTAYNGNSGPAGSCKQTDTPCIAYNYGYNAASNAYAYAGSLAIASQQWWLDVETANSWWSQTSFNQRVIQGAVDFLAHSGISAGVYSTHYQWNLLMGSYAPNLPVWYATAAGTAGAPSYCSNAYNFAGGGVLLVQYYDEPLDADYACGSSTSAPTPDLTATVNGTPGVTPTGTLLDTSTPTPPPIRDTVTPTSTATPTQTPTLASTATRVEIPGDANCDGRADAIDAALVLQYGAGLVATLPCQQNGDVNHDGSINAVDAALILQYEAGLLPHP